MNPVANLRETSMHGTDGPIWNSLHIWCPGCDSLHAVDVAGPDGYTPAVCWEFDGNLESPTISPSILCHNSVFLHEDGTQCADWANDYKTKTHTQGPCHSFIRAGQWEFLGDCAHKLAGQTVPMVPLPDYLVRD